MRTYSSTIRVCLVPLKPWVQSPVKSWKEGSGEGKEVEGYREEEERRKEREERVSRSTSELKDNKYQ